MPTLEVTQEQLDRFQLARKQFGIEANVADAAVVDAIVIKRGEEIELARGLLDESDGEIADALVFSRVIDGAAVAGEQACKASERAEQLDADLQLARQELAGVQGELNLARTSNPASGSSGTVASADVVALQDKLAVAQLDLQLSRGDVIPVIAEKLKARLKPATEGSTLNLGRSADGHGLMPVIDVIALFDGAQLGPKPGTQTSAQAIPLGRSAAEGEGDKPAAPVNPYATTIANLTGAAAK